MASLTRRDALLRLTALIGGAVFGGHRFLSGAVAARDEATAWLAAAELELLAEVAETILPATPESGGAKAANVAAFMEETARDFYDEAERGLLRSAPEQINEASRRRYGRGFLALTSEERYDLLLGLDRSEPQPDYYRMVKQLTLWGYWSSEVGMTQALNYLPVPGTFRGCVTVEPGTRAWSG